MLPLKGPFDWSSARFESGKLNNLTHPPVTLDILAKPAIGWHHRPCVHPFRQPPKARAVHCQALRRVGLVFRSRAARSTRPV
jgi:hypothetical protein